MSLSYLSLFFQSDTKAPGLLLVQGGGAAPDAAASSQQSVWRAG